MGWSLRLLSHGGMVARRRPVKRVAKPVPVVRPIDLSWELDSCVLEYLKDALRVRGITWTHWEYTFASNVVASWPVYLSDKQRELIHDLINS
jgi:hypothetical protein